MSDPTDFLVFISHDSRNAELAEAFSELLKNVSAGVLESFRSSDKKGKDGIEFGDDWYKAITSKINIASDVVCILTERSINRPWILYEAGMARGKSVPTYVHGLALGVPMDKVNDGPFYHFQNCAETEESPRQVVR